MTGIYLIKNKVNGKCYVGQAMDIKARWKRHIRDSKKKVKQTIHRAIAKYGIENFEFSILELCSADELDEREIHWIDELDTFNNGYNCTLGGGGSNQGKNCYSAEYMRAWKKSNHDKVIASHKAYYEANKDKFSAYNKAYKEANKEKVNAANKAYKEANKEKVRASALDYYYSHKFTPTPDHTEMPLW